MLSHISVLCAFLLLSHMSLYACAAEFLSTHPLMDICLFFYRGAIMNKAVMDGCACFCIDIYFSCLAGEYLGVEFLTHLLRVCLTLYLKSPDNKNLPSFSKVMVLFHTSP